MLKNRLLRAAVNPPSSNSFAPPTSEINVRQSGPKAVTLPLSAKSQYISLGLAQPTYFRAFISSIHSIAWAAASMTSLKYSKSLG
ncbi:hypothetical protein Ct61P_10643 [Colletotrichum tofieldiae]|nr:hypothetical protein Ct61P_10643 [Colletotrichum tofieldiae]